MDYKERLKQEYADLKDRYEKLILFRSLEAQNLSNVQIIMIDKQAKVMKEYLDILEVRCALEGVDLI